VVRLRQELLTLREVGGEIEAVAYAHGSRSIQRACSFSSVLALLRTAIFISHDKDLVNLENLVDNPGPAVASGSEKPFGKPCPLTDNLSCHPKLFWELAEFAFETRSARLPRWL
jgi:hypothetical protein